MSIKKRFETLNLKDQIQLYGIVFMCYIVVFLFYENIAKMLFFDTVKPTQKVFHKPVKNTDERVSNLEVYQHLNEIVKRYNIDLVETEIIQNSMKIEIRGEFDNIISFMREYDQKFTIDSYEMEKILHNTIGLFMVVDVGKLYDNKAYMKNKTPSINPYIKKVSKSVNELISSEVKKKSLIRQDLNIFINAIIGLEVLIDKEWYTIGDIYKHYKIIEIGTRSVVFVNIKTEKEMIVEIINE